MIYHQFEHFKNKVCYGFQHILATWCIHWSYPFNQLCTQIGHHFSYLIWATIWRMNPLFTSGICDNLFTKHSTTNVYPNGSPFLLPYLGYNMMYGPMSCENCLPKSSIKQ